MLLLALRLEFTFCDWALRAMIQAGSLKPKNPVSQDFTVAETLSTGEQMYSWRQGSEEK